MFIHERSDAWRSAASRSAFFLMSKGGGAGVDSSMNEEGMGFRFPDIGRMLDPLRAGPNLGGWASCSGVMEGVQTSGDGRDAGGELAVSI
jgi:hypothetical protein